ncbi:helix-turn-helix transcriptional regulator, partial [Rudaea sp.]|uniref:helix-turn-helix transcriptional regulator n=1 Tax=Rudaea sp. TaxID=2136325 RepID=UPI002ED17864
PRPRTEFGQGCGILRHSAAPGVYRHWRYAPPIELADWIEHFWLEEWRFDSSVPQTREVLPHPSVQMVFAANRSRIYGVQLGRFVRQLAGNDRIFGIKFRPGAFHPFLRKPVSAMANTSVLATEVFPDAADAEREVLACCDDGEMVQAATRFLVARLPPRDSHAQRARRMVEEIARDSSITRVEHLTVRWDIHERSLQRLFDRYVGASPRWVIKRYRIYEALESVGVAAQTGWAELAQNLGYFDQAHFINDFKKLVGCSPGEYARPLPDGDDADTQLDLSMAAGLR